MDIQFFRGDDNDTGSAGFGVRGRPDEPWRLIRPFLQSNTLSVLELAPDRLLATSVATSPDGLCLCHDLAVVISATKETVVSERIYRGSLHSPGLTTQLAPNGRMLACVSPHRLQVIDAQSLKSLRDWEWLEPQPSELAPTTGASATPSPDPTLSEEPAPFAGWRPYFIWSHSPAEHRARLDSGAIHQLQLGEPVQFTDDNRIVAISTPSQERSRGYYVFDLATGLVDVHVPPDGSGADLVPPLTGSTGQLARHAGPPGSLEIRPELCVRDECERDRVIKVEVPTIDVGGAIAAIEALAERFESAPNLDALIVDGVIKTGFVSVGEVWSAEVFFGRLVKLDWRMAAPSLRRLLLAYLRRIRGGEGCMPWHYSRDADSGDAGHALRALMMLDPDALDVYRLYLDKGDLEHDHGPYELYKEFRARHVVRDEAALRFGIYVSLKEFLDTDLQPGPILKAGERLVSPERFAALVMEEQKALEYPDFWNEYGREYVKYLRRAQTDYVRKVTANLPTLPF